MTSGRKTFSKTEFWLVLILSLSLGGILFAFAYFFREDTINSHSTVQLEGQTRAPSSFVEADDSFVPRESGGLVPIDIA